MTEPTIGWVLGVAHHKLAVAADDGTLCVVRRLPCAPWQDLDRLDDAL